MYVAIVVTELTIVTVGIVENVVTYSPVKNWLKNSKAQISPNI